MGQQQLLLLVLGVIIVGVAIVAGIGMFNASAEESVKDELTITTNGYCSKCSTMVSKNQSLWVAVEVLLHGVWSFQ